LNITPEAKKANGAGIGREMHDFIEQMYPICRSITGNGFRDTLSLIRRHIPLEIR